MEAHESSPNKRRLMVTLVAVVVGAGALVAAVQLAPSEKLASHRTSFFEPTASSKLPPPRSHTSVGSGPIGSDERTPS